MDAIFCRLCRVGSRTTLETRSPLDRSMCTGTAELNLMLAKRGARMMQQPSVQKNTTSNGSGSGVY